MKKRVLSMLLCLVLCCALLPVTALAALETPVITLDSHGKATWITVPGANEYRYTLHGRSGSGDSPSWITAGTTSNTSVDLSSYMTAGYSYRVELYAYDTVNKIESDYAYSTWTAYTPAPVTPTGATAVTSVAASVTAPTAGKTPSDAAPTITSADATLYDYDWYVDGSAMSKTFDTFAGGKTYTLKIRASTTSAFTSGTTATINGSPATVQSWDEHSILFYQDFTIAAVLTDISRIDATITEPVAGAKPSFTAATDADTYTLSNVRWQELDSDREFVANVTASDTFKPDTWYYLWIDATPNAGYQFTSTPGGYINGVKGGATSKSVGSPVKEVYKTYKTGAAKTLASIAITKAPTKTEYTVGNSFDPAGMVVTATYSDGSTAPVTEYTISPNGKLTEGHKSVTVSYTENYITKTATQAITVAAAKPNPFADVEESDYFYDAVQWAYYAEPQVTAGVSKTKFAPDSTVTRAQAVTFIWRAKGKPEPESMVSPFADVTNTKASYYKAVLWAVEQGITKGVSATKFGPAQKVTRGQMAIFLWRAENKPSVSELNTAHAASITNATTKKAVAWADSLKLLDGTAKAFTANAPCPRSDVVLYLYRQLAK